MMQKGMRHQQYMGFRGVAGKLGFGRIRQADFRTRVTIDTDGAQEAAANTGWQASFLGDSNSLPLALRTKEPSLAAGQSLPNEYLMCIRAVSLQLNQHTTGHTDIELAEICGKLGGSILSFKTGVDTVFERSVADLLRGAPGVDIRQGELASAAAPTVRSRLHKSHEGDDLDDPIVIFPGGSISIILDGQGAWTTTDDVLLDFVGHGWIALQGSVAQTAKVIGLAEAVDEAMRNPKGLAARAKV